MHPMLNIAISAAHLAGDIIRRYAGRVSQLEVMKKDKNDFVTKVDREAEQIIIYTLRKAYPDHAILGEESGQHEGKGMESADYEWIIDPLDGTTNFIYGIPHFAVSIAAKYKGRLLVGVIYDPIKDELFTAARGDGAILNNRRLRVSQRLSLENALLTTGIPFRPQQDLALYLETLKALIPGTAGIRRPGSAALDLAYVAANRYDGFWEFGLHPWDIAAGVLIVQEAGGIISDFEGNNNFFKTGNIIAAGPKVFREMLIRLYPIIQH